jgi:hypothetical protein
VLMRVAESSTSSRPKNAIKIVRNTVCTVAIGDILPLRLQLFVRLTCACKPYVGVHGLLFGCAIIFLHLRLDQSRELIARLELIKVAYSRPYETGAVRNVLLQYFQ